MSAALDKIFIFDRVTKRFGSFFDRHKVRALDEVNFVVRRGEVLGLLGPAGSGKSTALKLLGGLLEPNQGSIERFGVGGQRIPPGSRTGYLPAGFSLDCGLPCVNVLLDAAHDGGMTPASRLKRTQELFEFIGLGEAMEQKFGELPLEAQRCISLARGMAMDLDVLLLDDPLVGLDGAAQRKVKELIRKLARTGRSVVLSSRWLAEAMDLCDRVVVLFAGQVQTQGTLQEIFARPGGLRAIGPILSPGVSARALNAIWRETGGGEYLAVSPGPEMEKAPNAAKGDAGKAMDAAAEELAKEQKAMEKLAALAANGQVQGASTVAGGIQDEMTRANERLAELLSGK